MTDPTRPNLEEMEALVEAARSELASLTGLAELSFRGAGEDDLERALNAVPALLAHVKGLEERNADLEKRAATLDAEWECDEFERAELENALEKSEGENDSLRTALSAAQEEIGRLRSVLSQVAARASHDAPEGAFDPEPPAWAEDNFNGGEAFTCGYCGAWMHVVRPGKHQCENCNDGTDVSAIARTALQEKSDE